MVEFKTESIKVIHFGFSDDVKQALRDIMKQLEKDNIAITKNIQALRFFSRDVPNHYKKDGVVFITKILNKKMHGNLIYIPKRFKVERSNENSFLIVEK